MTHIRHPVYGTQVYIAIEAKSRAGVSLEGLSSQGKDHGWVLASAYRGRVACTCCVCLSTLPAKRHGSSYCRGPYAEDSNLASLCHCCRER